MVKESKELSGSLQNRNTSQLSGNCLPPQPFDRPTPAALSYPLDASISRFFCHFSLIFVFRNGIIFWSRISRLSLCERATHRGVQPVRHLILL